MTPSKFCLCVVRMIEGYPSIQKSNTQPNFKPNQKNFTLSFLCQKSRLFSQRDIQLFRKAYYEFFRSGDFCKKWNGMCGHTGTKLNAACLQNHFIESRRPFDILPSSRFCRTHDDYTRPKQRKIVRKFSQYRDSKCQKKFENFYFQWFFEHFNHFINVNWEFLKIS